MVGAGLGVDVVDGDAHRLFGIVESDQRGKDGDRQRDHQHDQPDERHAVARKTPPGGGGKGGASGEINGH
ncbi:MAG: hypothetical protein R2911_28850 [Caldilineaceae bacterium]